MEEAADIGGVDTTKVLPLWVALAKMPVELQGFFQHARLELD